MSQFWHAHWAEDAFKPTKLQNWEVPNWHAEWPNRHCETTKAEAHNNGRLFENFKRPKNPWSKFKGTWELPLKIDRPTANKLSKFTEYKKAFWRGQKIKHETICRMGNNNDLLSISTNEEDKNEIKKEQSLKKQSLKEQSLKEDNLDVHHLNFKDCIVKKTCVL